MHSIDIEELLRDFYTFARRVRDGREKIVVSLNGQPLVALTPLEDAEQTDGSVNVSTAPISVDRAAIKAILARAASRGAPDKRTDDDIVGYDERGLPR